MQEDGPFLPGVFKGALQFFDVVHHPEAALGIGVIERIGTRGCGWRGCGRYLQRSAGLSGLTRQVVGQGRSGYFVSLAHVGQPLGRHAVAQECLPQRRARTGALWAGLTVPPLRRRG